MAHRQPLLGRTGAAVRMCNRDFMLQLRPLCRRTSYVSRLEHQLRKSKCPNVASPPLPQAHLRM
eukprot:351539-Chlamydomonas_euryale.AAC.3